MFSLVSTPSRREMAGKLKAIDRSLATIEFDLDGRIITANENFLATIGYTLEEIRDKHHSMLCEPGVRGTSEYQQFWRALNNGEFKAGEFRRLGKGGREIWLQASYNPLLGRTGKPIGIMKVAIDMTKVKEIVSSAAAAQKTAMNQTANTF